MAGFVPIEAKLRPPAQPGGLVARGQLIDLLLESVGAPVVLVTGPAGYGKTVLASQWADEDDRPFAWLFLDEADNDPGRLVTYLMLALQRVEALDTGTLAVLAGDRPSITGLLPRLGVTLQQRHQPFVLVLDGVEALTSPVAMEVVSVVAAHLPAGSQLTLVGRSAAHLDLAGLRAGRQLVEVTTDDLRLSRAEAVALVQATGCGLDERDVDALLELTEGWAAGMYLATVSLSGASSRRVAVDTLAGSDSLIAGYVRDEMLEGLTPEDQVFLRRVSIATRMSGPLCDALLSASGSADVLQRLAQVNGLLVRLDGEGQWFRLHRLVAEALQAELQRHEPQLVKLLHSRACGWLEEHGDREEAIAHAIAGGDVERAGRLIWAETFACMATGRVTTIERWLDSFEPYQVAAQAKLALTAAWCSLQRGRSADHWISSAERGRYDAHRKPEAASVAAACALLRATVARNGLEQMAADARLAVELQQPDDPWLCFADLLDAVAIYLTGHPTEAHRELEAVERLARACDGHHVRALALAELALMAIDDGDWDTAQDLNDEAGALVDAHGLAELSTLALIPCVTSLITAQQGQAEEAAALVRQCVKTVALTAHPAAWGDAQCRLVLARTQLTLGQPTAARSLLAEAQELLASTPDATLLSESVEQTRREIERIPVEVGAELPALTSAELRVLQFLPTHLSFEDIGRELFVSRNTVKTQAVTAYRKLGVNSRSEAVERAYALGLIAR